MSLEYQRRYFATHINSMVDLCYPAIVKNHERIDKSAIPLFIDCINRLNKSVAFMQYYSDSLTEEQSEWYAIKFN